MCFCTPNKRTPWCGKPGCEAPKKTVSPPREIYPEHKVEHHPTIVMMNNGLSYRVTPKRVKWHSKEKGYVLVAIDHMGVMLEIPLSTIKRMVA